MQLSVIHQKYILFFNKQNPFHKTKKRKSFSNQNQKVIKRGSEKGNSRHFWVISPKPTRTHHRTERDRRLLIYTTLQSNETFLSYTNTPKYLERDKRKEVRERESRDIGSVNHHLAIRVSKPSDSGYSRLVLRSPRVNATVPIKYFFFWLVRVSPIFALSLSLYLSPIKFAFSITRIPTPRYPIPRYQCPSWNSDPLSLKWNLKPLRFFWRFLGADLIGLKVNELWAGNSVGGEGFDWAVRSWRDKWWAVDFLFAFFFFSWWLLPGFNTVL